jgi:hypothetical protein
VDLVINNAGYGLFGAIEETSEKEARDQMGANFFGPINWPPGKNGPMSPMPHMENNE